MALTSQSRCTDMFSLRFSRGPRTPWLRNSSGARLEGPQPFCIGGTSQAHISLDEQLSCIRANRGVLRGWFQQIHYVSVSPVLKILFGERQQCLLVCRIQNQNRFELIFPGRPVTGLQVDSRQQEASIKLSRR